MWRLVTGLLGVALFVFGVAALAIPAAVFGLFLVAVAIVWDVTVRLYRRRRRKWE